MLSEDRPLLGCGIATCPSRKSAWVRSAMVRSAPRRQAPRRSARSAPPAAGPHCAGRSRTGWRAPGASHQSRAVQDGRRKGPRREVAAGQVEAGQIHELQRSGGRRVARSTGLVAVTIISTSPRTTAVDRKAYCARHVTSRPPSCPFPTAHRPTERLTKARSPGRRSAFEPRNRRALG